MYPLLLTKDPFYIGITLDELSAISTDSDWNEGIVEPNPVCIFKSLKLRNLGIYCSTDSLELTSPKSEIESNQNNIPKSSRQYILDPVSGTGKLTWLKLMNLTLPQYDLSVVFDEIAFNLDEMQYRTFISVFGSFSRNAKAYPYRRFRPPRTITYKMDPQAWIRYAGLSVLSGIRNRREKWTWDFFKSRRDLRIRFVSLYVKYKLNTISNEGLDELANLQAILSFEDLRYYRKIAFRRLAVPTHRILKLIIEDGISPANTTWIGWITGTSVPIKKTQGEQLQDLFDAFNNSSQSNVKSSDLPETVNGLYDIRHYF